MEVGATMPNMEVPTEEKRAYIKVGTTAEYRPYCTGQPTSSA
jgi:hypothetical protein